MDSPHTDRVTNVDPEEPTRPAWLLTDPTEAIDEPRVGGPYDAPPSMAREQVAPPVAAPPSTKRAALMGALAGAVVAALVSAGIVAATDHNEPASNAASAAPVAVANGQALDVHAVLAAVEDAVVAINVEGIGQFGGTSRGAGSGMIIDENGLILTNNHVIADATSISVTLADGRDVDADLVGSNPSNDVALVRARNVENLPTVSFGRSGD